jgi:hypothetical protein
MASVSVVDVAHLESGVPPPPPVASVPHERTPFVDFTSQLAAFKFETMSAEVDAVPVTKRLVVVAFLEAIKFVVEARPLLKMAKRVEDAESITSNERVEADVSPPHRVNREYGVEVPMPTRSVLSVSVTEVPLLSHPPPVAEIGAIITPEKFVRPSEPPTSVGEDVSAIRTYASR